MNLKANAFTPFTTKEIRPKGWMRRQLEIQAKGLSGNLDKIWPDVRDSKWIGGSKEGWERVPYWLDGFIPLAYLLEDADLQSRAQRYIDAILANQQEDGWLCPCAKDERGGYDMWALFLMGKVLVLYHDCAGDDRVEDTLYRAFFNYKEHINHFTLFGWAAARWYEALIPLYWLYARRPETWLLELAHLIKLEGLNYAEQFGILPMDAPTELPFWSFQTHVVNIAMAIKAEGLYSKLTGDSSLAATKHMLHVLDTKHGTAPGHFTGDECLAGNLPTAGTELCGVVEAMYSYETLLAITGDPYWGDRLELLAYNALPATISPDMWTHQYDQMVNQISCEKLPKDAVHFTSNEGESHLFGLEPNYGCCTANFNQGWPKFALSAFMKSSDGIAVTALIPALLTTSVQGIQVEIEINTEYPFQDCATIVVRAEKPVDFPLSIRIPGTAQAAYLDGAQAIPGSFVTVCKTWSGETAVDLSLVCTEAFTQRPTGLTTLRRGSLLFALPLAETWEKHEYLRDGVERKFPYCDYTITSTDSWAFGFAGEVKKAELQSPGAFPFASKQPPITLQVQLAPLAWKQAHGVCKPFPESTVPAGAPVWKTFIPYGCTTLRMTELPLIK